MRERLELREREAGLMAQLAPALEAPGDPPVVHERLILVEDGGASAGDPFLVIGRPKESELRAYVRHYDGMRGGTPQTYVLLTTWFRTANGHTMRTRGVGVYRDELAALGEALTRLADDLDAAEGIE